MRRDKGARNIRKGKIKKTGEEINLRKGRKNFGSQGKREEPRDLT